jgi:hypothetical protein
MELILPQGVNKMIYNHVDSIHWKLLMKIKNGINEWLSHNDD